MTNTPKNPKNTPNNEYLVIFSSRKKIAAIKKEKRGIAPLKAPAIPDNNKEEPFT